MADKGNEAPETSQTTTAVLTPEQQSLIGLAMPSITSFATNPPSVPTQSYVAGFNPTQISSQNMALGAATGAQQDVANTALDVSKFLSGDVLDLDNNKYIQDYINAATKPISDQLFEETLPALRGSEITAGQYGGTRGDIAEGLAAGKASQAIGATTAGIVNNAYNSGLNALVSGAQMLPQTAALQAVPAATTAAVGDVRQQLTQAGLSEDEANYWTQTMLPFLTSSQIVGMAAALPGGSTTTTASPTTYVDPWLAALGGAGTGAAIGNMVMPGGVGAGLGALLGGAGGYYFTA